MRLGEMVIASGLKTSGGAKVTTHMRTLWSSPALANMVESAAFQATVFTQPASWAANCWTMRPVCRCHIVIFESAKKDARNVSDIRDSMSFLMDIVRESRKEPQRQTQGGVGHYLRRR